MMSWNEVLHRNFIGGDLEIREGGTSYRGPIASAVIDVDEGRVKFHFVWCARLLGREDNWQKWPDREYTVDVSVLPSSCGDGRFYWMDNNKVVTLFPPGRNLDPREVKGIEFEVEWLPVAGMLVDCSYRVPTEQFGAHSCRKSADTAVVDPETGIRYFRCPEHRGMLREGVTGEVTDTVAQRTNRVKV